MNETVFLFHLLLICVNESASLSIAKISLTTASFVPSLPSNILSVVRILSLFNIMSQYSVSL